jgi:hypothetical protein
MTEKTTPPTVSGPELNGEPPDKPKLDPYDPANLRANAAANIEVETVLTTVPVRKPKRTDFVRTHPDPAYTVDMYCLERDTGMDRETYMVLPEVQHLVLEELRLTRIITAINRRGTPFLWPIRLPVEGSDRNRRVAETAMLAAEQAKQLWVRVLWNADISGYSMQRAKGDIGEPQWPDKSMRDLLEIAFRHYLIDRPDHPVIRELAGEL